MLLATPLSLSPILEDKIPLCIPPQAGFALRWCCRLHPQLPPKSAPRGVTMGRGARGLPAPISNLPSDPGAGVSALARGVAPMAPQEWVHPTWPRCP